MDVLNILACMGVLLLHCTNQEIHDFSGRLSFNWFLGLLTHSFMLWPVDVFFMLSGFTLIRQHSGGGKSILFKKNKKAFATSLVLEYGIYAYINAWLLYARRISRFSITNTR